MEEVVATNTSSTSPSWPQLLGSDHWHGLLDPLDLSLRELVLLCGDFCQVTYDSFVSDVHSKYCGACRYGRRNLLRHTSFPSADLFSVSEYLYATSEVDLPASLLLFSLSREAWSRESNWLGFVAVSSDAAAARNHGRRDIFVAWRGTIRDLEWVDVLRPELVPIHHSSDDEEEDSSSDDEEEEKPKVMKGWHTIYTSSDARSPFTKTSARDQLLARIKQLVELYKHDALSIVCVGHSLGASLAVLSAYDIVESGLSKTDQQQQHFPVCAVVFGSPQVGNRAFDERLRKLPNLRVLHVRNKPDLIPLYPSALLGYVDTGTQLVVDTRKSPYLKDSRTPGDWHNLQGMLHSVAGWNGERGEFELRVRRSVAIVNKSCDYLKDECLVPGSWWVEKNRGMVLREDDGEWEVAPPDEEDLPVPSYVLTGTGADPTAAGADTSGINKPAPGRFCTII